MGEWEKEKKENWFWILKIDEEDEVIEAEQIEKTKTKKKSWWWLASTASELPKGSLGRHTLTDQQYRFFLIFSIRLWPHFFCYILKPTDSLGPFFFFFLN